uniref:Uncharacterized protein n=1 Tax=Meloidogyne enterolobii TaxID=390850 RepID=A0A6V7XTD5_MELEN|nr:unnamed protein product [Meloidogyne enterolobii]
MLVEEGLEENLHWPQHLFMIQMFYKVVMALMEYFHSFYLMENYNVLGLEL